MIKLDVSIAREEICEESIFFVCLFKYFSSFLEPNGIGTKYPLIFKDLYNGILEKSNALAARKELEEIRETLKTITISISEVKDSPIFKSKEFVDEVKDFDLYLNKNAHNLYEVFITSGMRENFIDALHYSTIRSEKFDSDIEIVYSPI